MSDIHLRHLGGALLAATLLVTPLAAQAVQDRVDRTVTMTPGDSNGSHGYWVTVKERVFHWTPAYFQQLKDLYHELFGDSLTVSDAGLQSVADKIASGQLTFDDLRQQLTALKDDLSNLSENGVFPPNSDPPAGPNYDYHLRPYDLHALEARWGIAISDDQARYADALSNESAPNNDAFYHNTRSCLSQAYRFLVISQAMQSGLLPDVTFASPLTGNFSQYAGSSSYDTYNHQDPYLQKFASPTGYTVWSGYSTLFNLSVKSLTTDEAVGLAKALYTEVINTQSPVAFDLNGDGKIGVTGKSTAKLRNPKNTFVAADAVSFDLLASGKAVRTEWLDRQGDAFLVDDRHGAVTKASRGEGRLDGSLLFGNAGGNLNGFTKLAKLLDTPALIADRSGLMPVTSDGILRGKQLTGLLVWQDRNHDGRVQPDEMKTLNKLGITEISLRPRYVLNADHEYLMRTFATRHGKRILCEDVWFATDPADAGKR